MQEASKDLQTFNIARGSRLARILLKLELTNAAQ
jgi:hypothetical protein